ncbi:VacB/RNase II family 3'-5' exoribonuclease [Nitrosophilus alvini]|uniref:VacB/RNase II family 3'-5' exoribonuclease n=1 Tax=Nitrosophilus alvini TaxID=2714855 RepID=UPI00190B913F|nr:ribonuclease R family protein [Nitrosophilus alvini]
MKELLLKLIRGMPKKDILKRDMPLIDDLRRLKIIKDDGKIVQIRSKYRVGKIDVAKKGTGYLEVLGEKTKDLLIEPENLAGATKGDLVIAKRIFKKSGRPSAKVVYIVEKAFRFSVAYFDKDNMRFLNVKNLLPVTVHATKKSLNLLPNHTVVKIDNENHLISEVLGVLEDPKVDEKISLALYNKKEEFSKEAELEASGYATYVDKELYPERIDLTHLPFCTIDPATAKDHDDAIYFDTEENALYVAIADVSEYVTMFGPIDQEAKERGFSIYFPHKSIPMLPRALSEGICSLKPEVNRLAFVSKITLDKTTLKPIKEELFEAIIKSRRKYSYERIDEFLEGKFEDIDETDKEILKFLLPLSKVTGKLRKIRLQKGFEFTNPEIRIILDDELKLVATKIEEETESHALIEDCMLLANKATAKMFEYGIFRTHEEPDIKKIEEMLDDLATIGIFAKQYRNIHELIRSIQKQAQELGVQKHVDKLIIRAQKQAAYTADNIGHFGLGFEEYTHFTSPIRRYSDLTLHRLLKAILDKNDKKLDYILRNIESLTVKISELEREAARVEWDFIDRKFARWAKENIGKSFKAVITDPQSMPIAVIEDEIIGARVFLLDEDVELFEKVLIEIKDADLATTKIIGKIVQRLDMEENRS